MLRRAASVLTLVAVMTLAACAGPAESEGEAVVPTPSSTAEPEQVETDEPSAEPTSEVDPASGSGSGSSDGSGSGSTTEPLPSDAPFTEADLVTVAGNPAFAAVMAVGDYCSPDIAAFARDYRGEFIRFPGYVLALDDSATNASRLDILVGASPYATASPVGPAFQFRNVQPDPDMGLVGTVFPGMINLGESFTFTAEVLSFDSGSCVLVLDPYSSVVLT